MTNDTLRRDPAGRVTSWATAFTIDGTAGGTTPVVEAPGPNLGNYIPGPWVITCLLNNSPPVGTGAQRLQAPAVLNVTIQEGADSLASVKQPFLAAWGGRFSVHAARLSVSATFFGRTVTAGDAAYTGLLSVSRGSLRTVWATTQANEVPAGSQLNTPGFRYPGWTGRWMVTGNAASVGVRVRDAAGIVATLAPAYPLAANQASGVQPVWVQPAGVRDAEVSNNDATPQVLAIAFELAV